MTTQEEEQQQTTSASEWKLPSLGSIVTLPSGNVARIKAVGMEGLISTGKIPNSLLGIIKAQLDNNEDKPTGKPGEDTLELDDIFDDPQKLADLVGMVDVIASTCFVEPRVWPVPDEGEERKNSRLYADEVAFEDKMFVFNNAVGGTKDVERFRDELASSVDNVQSVAGSQDSA